MGGARQWGGTDLVSRRHIKWAIQLTLKLWAGCAVDSTHLAEIEATFITVAESFPSARGVGAAIFLQVGKVVTNALL